MFKNTIRVVIAGVVRGHVRDTVVVHDTEIAGHCGTVLNWIVAHAGIEQRARFLVDPPMPFVGRRVHEPHG